jgi:hypothetical protein
MDLVSQNQNQPTVVLMLSGWATSGKDAAAALLTEEMGFIRVAFADELKKSVAAANFLPLELFHNTGLKDRLIPYRHTTPRQLLLSHALAERAMDPDVYARKVATVIKLAVDHGVHRVVISDWRYKREYDFLEHELLGVATILSCRITRPGVVPTKDPSEHDLDNQPMHAMIDNNGSITDLRDLLKAMLRVQGVLS